MKKENDEIQLIYLLFRWRKVILITVLIASGIAIIGTMPQFLPPTFKAEAIIYPPASYSDKLIAEYDLRFGADKEIDEHIQILRSSILRDSIINKYKLMQHYNIANDDKYKLNKLFKQFEENVAIDRTRFNAISITVMDKDPVIAANLCNDFVKLGDQVKTIILKQNLAQTIVNIEKSIELNSEELDALAKSINKIDSRVVLKYGNLLKQTSAERFKMQLDLHSLVDAYKLKDDLTVVQLLVEYETKLLKFNSLKDSYEQANISLNGRIANSYIITPAEVPDKKFAPKRSLIVLAFSLAAFIIACFTVIFVNRFNSFKKNFK
jgi:uncharacterized protein involved in exopolysaccharide biosynthesis